MAIARPPARRSLHRARRASWDCGDASQWAPRRTRHFPRDLSRRAFSLLEVLVVVAILGVLMAILLPTLAKVRASHRSTTCVSSLRQLGSAFQLFAQDNDLRYPNPAIANRSWEQMLRPYYSATFQCPADNELAPVVGSSYDWRDTGDSTTTLAGRSLAEISRPDAVLAFEALPGWHTKARVNVVRVDGSADSIDEEQCNADLRAPLTVFSRPNPN